MVYLKVPIVDRYSVREMLIHLGKTDGGWPPLEKWDRPPMCDEDGCSASAVTAVTIIECAEENGIPFWFCTEHAQSRIIEEGE